ncbi:MAG: ketoacyl-ACP synthase III [Myxococcota bacterium]
MIPRSAQIVSSGRYVPARRVDNAFFDDRFGDGTGDWLIRNVGIGARHWMAPDECTSDMAAAAARQALHRAGISVEQIDLIVLATDTPDQLSPATSARVQALLGAPQAGTFDVNCACAAWVTALDLASRIIATDPDVNTAVVIGAYAMSRFLNPGDKRTATLFADGAGAVVLVAGDGPGFLAGVREAEGRYWDALGIFDGGSRQPSTVDAVSAAGPPHVAFARRLPATFNLERWPAMVRRVAKKASLSLDDVDLYLFTQLNLRTIEAVMEDLGQPMQKTHWIMDKWGYTGSACVPMALDDAIEKGRLSPGDRVLFCASGGGVSLAAAVVQWT